MKTAQTKIDVAKGALTMEFGGDMIKFKVPESVKNPNDVRSYFAIDVIDNIGQERTAPIKNNAFQTMNGEGIGMKHKGHVPAIKEPPDLAESTPCAFVHNAATSTPPIGKSPTPIPIPISTNRLLPSVVQVPNQIKGGRRVRVDAGKRTAKIRKEHYPRPFKDSTYEYVVDDIILRDVDPIQA